MADESSYTIKGGGDCQWGIGDTVEFGRITDLNIDDEIISEDIETQQGAVDGVVIYDGKTTLTATVIAGASSTPPAKGGIITIGDKGYLLEKVGTAKKHKGKVTFHITARAGDNLILSGGA